MESNFAPLYKLNFKIEFIQTTVGRRMQIGKQAFSIENTGVDVLASSRMDYSLDKTRLSIVDNIQNIVKVS